MKKSNIGILLLLSLFLAGCGANSSTHGTEKQTKVDVNIVNHGAGSITISSPLDLLTESATTQDTANQASEVPTLRLQLTEGGSTAAGEGSTLDDIISKFKPDLSKRDSENVTTPEPAKIAPKPAEPAKPAQPTEPTKPGEPASPVDIPVVDDGTGPVPIPAPEEKSEDMDFDSKKSYTAYGQRNGGRWAWRIPDKWSIFGKKIKIVFDNGHTVYVNNAEYNYREKTGIRDGFVWKPGIGPNGEGEADRGTAHGGPYVHAPYKMDTRKLTIYYNKQK